MRYDTCSMTHDWNGLFIPMFGVYLPSGSRSCGLLISLDEVNGDECWHVIVGGDGLPNYGGRPIWALYRVLLSVRGCKYRDVLVGMLVMAIGALVIRFGE